MDYPIIFSGPMIRALWDDRKTQTRRLAWRDAEFGLQDYASEQIEDFDVRGWSAVRDEETGKYRVFKPSPWQKVKPGDRLWVRESWRTLHKWDCLKPRNLADDISKITYEADPENRNPLWAFGKLRPAIHMPRWASRITLLVEAVKVERLQDISEEDARAEGARDAFGEWFNAGEFGDVPADRVPPVTLFAGLWTQLHGADSWSANPEICALSFRCIRKNIDAIKEAA